MPGSRYPNLYHPFWRSLAYWIFVTLAVLAAFFTVRQLTLCWTLTDLSGIPPAECALQDQPSSEMPALPDPAIANDLPVEISAPELELPQWDSTAAMLTNDFVRDCVVVEMNAVHLFAAGLCRLLNGVGDFISFTKTPAHFALAITRDDEGGETEAAATFDDLGTSVDMNHFFDGVRTVSISAWAIVFC